MFTTTTKFTKSLLKLRLASPNLSSFISPLWDQPTYTFLNSQVCCEAHNSNFTCSYVPRGKAMPKSVILSFQNLLLDKLNAIELLKFIL